MNRGYWLDDGKELINPDLKYEGVSDYVALGDNTWDISHAEEEVIKIREPIAAKSKEGIDNVSLTGCGSYIYGNSSFIRKRGEGGTNIFHQFHSMIPDSHFHSGRDSVNGTWRIKVGSSNTLTIPLPNAEYEFKLHTYQGSEVDRATETN